MNDTNKQMNVAIAGQPNVGKSDYLIASSA
jgi:tRNA U34 5-carboxymethylaminomethyl modifying GTPase MnmE/TrmE